MSLRYYLFVCDSSTNIGTGHVARCLNLAERLSANPINHCVFLHRDLENSNSWLIEKRGFTLCIYSDMQSLPSVITSLGIHPTCLIFDNYEIAESLEKKCESIASNIFVIDDLFDRAHFCKFLLNQNLIENAAQKYKMLLPDNCELFLGPEYALLGREYTEGKTVSINQTITKILVFFGGTDPTQETLKFLPVAQRFPSITFQFVVGKNCIHGSELTKKASTIPNTTVHIQVNSLLPFFLNSDLYIGAGGSTSWERTTTGLPGAVVSVADNQIEMSMHLERNRVQSYLGHFSSVTEDDYSVAIEKMTLQARREFYTNSLALRTASKLDNLVNKLEEI